MESPEPFIRLHGQTRSRTIGLTLGALAFMVGLRYAAVISAAPESLGWVDWLFQAAAAVLFVGFVLSVWHAFAPRVEITVRPYPLIVGGKARIEWAFEKEETRVSELRVEAHFHGVRFDREGHRAKTPRRVPLLSVEGAEARRGSMEVEIPSDLVPSRRRRGQHETHGKWTLEVRARVEGAPGVHESYPVRIMRG